MYEQTQMLDFLLQKLSYQRALVEIVYIKSEALYKSV